MGDDLDGTRWMTYAELGEARRISKASATRLVFRRGWRRQVGNDGIARAAVPMAEATPQLHDKSHDDLQDITEKLQDQRIDVSPLYALLDTRVRELGEEIERRARAEGELTGMRAAINTLQAALDTAQHEAQEAREDARRARDQAATEKHAANDLRAALARVRGRGMLRRLLNREG